MPRPAQELPSELTAEIISWLPVKSLVRFKSVCRSWHSLIESPDFISRHLNRSHARGLGNYRNGALYLFIRNCLSAVRELRVSLLSSETLELVPPIDIPFHMLAQWNFNIIGSCNGIVCGTSYSDFSIFLWNPATRESRVLPDCIISQASLDVPGVTVVFGFRYDCAADDYKLVRILFTLYSSDPIFLAEVFSLSERLWREVPALVCHVDPESTVAVNGFLYWIGCSDDKGFMLSFNLQNEGFQRVPLPALDFLGEDIHRTLSVYDSSLCLIAYSHREWRKSLDLWVMSGEPGNESWTKRLSTGPIFGVEWPFGCSINGEIFMRKSKRKLAVYKPRNDSIQHLPIKVFSDLHLYIESLVPVSRK